MSPDLRDALAAHAPWWGTGRPPTAVELERWLARVRPSVRVEYLARLLDLAGRPLAEEVARS